MRTLTLVLLSSLALLACGDDEGDKAAPSTPDDGGISTPTPTGAVDSSTPRDGATGGASMDAETSKPATQDDAGTAADGASAPSTRQDAQVDAAQQDAATLDASVVDASQVDAGDAASERDAGDAASDDANVEGDGSVAECAATDTSCTETDCCVGNVCVSDGAGGGVCIKLCESDDGCAARECCAAVRDNEGNIFGICAPAESDYCK